jgi:hypothetical protein
MQKAILSSTPPAQTRPTWPGMASGSIPIRIKLGNTKLEKLGDWQIAYAYRKLEVDAWPDFLPYSDFYNGYTGAKGHQAQFSFGLAKNTSLAVNFLVRIHFPRPKDNPYPRARRI